LVRGQGARWYGWASKAKRGVEQIGERRNVGEDGSQTERFYSRIDERVGNQTEMVANGNQKVRGGGGIYKRNNVVRSKLKSPYCEGRERNERSLLKKPLEGGKEEGTGGGRETKVEGGLIFGEPPVESDGSVGEETVKRQKESGNGERESNKPK